MDVQRAISARKEARAALDKLLAGNRRFVRNQLDGHHRGPQWRLELIEGQEPFAVVLSCVDSRVPAEMIFDEGFGDLLVIRTAGQSLRGTAVLGSVEFGVRVLEISLTVVLGHTECGAVAAALSDDPLDSHLGDLAGEVHGRLDANVAGDPRAATAANVRAAVGELRALDTLVFADGTPSLVVGLLYDLTTGVIDVVDDDGLLDD